MFYFWIFSQLPSSHHWGFELCVSSSERPSLATFDKNAFCYPISLLPFFPCEAHWHTANYITHAPLQLDVALFWPMKYEPKMQCGALKTILKKKEIHPSFFPSQFCSLKHQVWWLGSSSHLWSWGRGHSLGMLEKRSGKLKSLLNLWVSKVALGCLLPAFF